MSAHTGSFVDEDGVARQVTVYNGHRCEPADVESWVAVLETRERLKADAAARPPEPPPDKVTLLDVPDDLKFDMTKYLYYPGGDLPPGVRSVDFPCPTCDAEPLEPCWSRNIGILKRGEKKAIRAPHNTRVLLAGINTQYMEGRYIEEYEAYAKRHQIEIQHYLDYK